MKAPGVKTAKITAGDYRVLSASDDHLGYIKFHPPYRWQARIRVSTGTLIRDARTMREALDEFVIELASAR